MEISKIMDRVLFALSVPKCVACDKRLDYGDKAFCPECSAVFEEFKTRNCSRCAKVLNKCDCSNNFLSSHFVKKTIKCFRYIHSEQSSPASSLIFSLKRDNRFDVLEKCTDEISQAILNSISEPKEYIFTNIPRRRSAIIEYGIDHSELLAKAVAKELGGRYIPLLRSNSKKAQKMLDRTERFQNADFSINRRRNLTDKGVIIIDDVITTGASMSKAASLIRSMGAKDIIAATLGIAYKDDNNFPNYQI